MQKQTISSRVVLHPPGGLSSAYRGNAFLFLEMRADFNIFWVALLKQTVPWSIFYKSPENEMFSSSPNPYYPPCRPSRYLPSINSANTVHTYSIATVVFAHFKSSLSFIQTVQRRTTWQLSEPRPCSQPLTECSKAVSSNLRLQRQYFSFLHKHNAGEINRILSALSHQRVVEQAWKGSLHYRQPSRWCAQTRQATDTSRQGCLLLLLGL